MMRPLLVLCFAGVAVAAPPKVEVDIVYGKAGDRDLKLDLAKPAGKGPFPAVVVLHGGGWRLGNKRDVRSWVQALAEEGFVAAGVGYRLAPDAKFPSQIEDCKTAVRFLRANADKFGIDKDRVAAMGFSAGGHLACLLGLTDTKAGFDGSQHPDESSAVQAVVDYFGPADLAGFAKDATAQRGMLGPLIGKPYADDPKAHDKASPIHYVTKSAPPFLILHGTKDNIVPVAQSRDLLGKLKDVGVPAELIEVDGEGHGWVGKKNAETSERTIEFLKERLKK